MRLSLEPVRVNTGCKDETGRLVFDEERRLVAVLVELSDDHEDLAGHWFLEVGFGPLDGPSRPTFPDLEAAQAWIGDELGKRKA